MALRATVMVTAFAGVSACADGGDGPRGSVTPQPPPLGACLDASGATQPVGSASVEGRVEEVGLGMPDPARMDGCPFGGTLRFGPPSLGDAALLAQVSWLRFRDADNQAIVLSALAEGSAFPLVPGDMSRFGRGKPWRVTTAELEGPATQPCRSSKRKEPPSIYACPMARYRSSAQRRPPAQESRSAWQAFVAHQRRQIEACVPCDYMVHPSNITTFVP